MANMMTNQEFATTFRQIAAVYQILGENRFKIIAYERAADAIEHEPRRVIDLIHDGKMEDIPGIGSTIRGHILEFVETGRISHFDTIFSKVPAAIFPLLSVPGIGPKKAMAIVDHLKLTDRTTACMDVLAAAKAHKLQDLPGFGPQSESLIRENIERTLQFGAKEKRILLSSADEIATLLSEYLRKDPAVKHIDTLGSLRRRSPTIGDIDLAVVTDDPEAVIDRFVAYPHETIIERGPTGASILLTNGVHVDLRIANESSYGAMLQYFTGSKNHNVRLRTRAGTLGLSLSEYGIKVENDKEKDRLDKLGKWNETRKLFEFKDEQSFYSSMGITYIPPELREDRGEIEAGLAKNLPREVTLADVRGDLHIHTSYDLSSSHDLGDDPVSVVFDTASELGYEYVGISDHNPSVSTHTEQEVVEIMKKRYEWYQAEQKKWEKKTGKTIGLFVMLEIDITPEGSVSLPQEAFNYLDAAVASVHSSFTMDRDAMTDRIIKAITSHPKIRILGHPTGRLLLKREGYQIDWDRLVAACLDRDIALEINASPSRLDLGDEIVTKIRKSGVKFVVNTDSHRALDMWQMPYGLSVCRRGWLEAKQIMNTHSYSAILNWLTKS
jgi:DNA polymerase (family 10)